MIKKELLIVQILLILILMFLILYLLKLNKSIHFEKRIGKFSLTPVNDKELSFFDNVYIKIWQLIKEISKILSKSTFLTKYGYKFEKHISYEESELKEGIDYISIKLIIGLLFIIINIIFSVFRYLPFQSILFLISFLIGFFLLDIILFISFKRKRKQIENDLLKAIIIMNNAFKSGRNIIQAIEIVKNELKGPISDEFKKIYMDLNYGLSIEVVFNRFYQRVQIEDAKYITSSLSLLNRTGGNIVRVFSTIERSFFDKKKLRDELKSMTSQSVFVYRLLIGLPFFIAIVIFILNPNYYNPLFNSVFGILCILLTLLLMILYIIIVKKVLKVEI